MLASSAYSRLLDHWTLRETVWNIGLCDAFWTTIVPIFTTYGFVYLLNRGSVRLDAVYIYDNLVNLPLPTPRRTTLGA